MQRRTQAQWDRQHSEGRGVAALKSSSFSLLCEPLTLRPPHAHVWLCSCYIASNSIILGILPEIPAEHTRTCEQGGEREEKQAEIPKAR